MEVYMPTIKDIEKQIYNKESQMANETRLADVENDSARRLSATEQSSQAQNHANEASRHQNIAQQIQDEITDLLEQRKAVQDEIVGLEQQRVDIQTSRDLEIEQINNKIIGLQG